MFAKSPCSFTGSSEGHDWDDIIASLDQVGEAIARAAIDRRDPPPAVNDATSEEERIIRGATMSTSVEPHARVLPSANTSATTPSDWHSEYLAEEDGRLITDNETSNDQESAIQNKTDKGELYRYQKRLIQCPLDSTCHFSVCHISAPPTNNIASRIAMSSVQEPTYDGIPHQAYLQAPRKFKSYGDLLEGFSSVAPALPPKTTQRLKPVTVNFNGGSRVALSQVLQPKNFVAASHKSELSPVKPIPSLEAQQSSHFSMPSKHSYSNITSSPLPGSSPQSPSMVFSYSMLSATPKPAAKTFVQSSVVEANANNNNGGMLSSEDKDEDPEVIPNGIVSSRIARFSAKNNKATKWEIRSSTDNMTSSASFIASGTSEPNGHYEGINSTGPYDNLDPNLRYHDQPSEESGTPPSLPPKTYKAMKSPRTGTRVIPVSESVMSTPPISPRPVEKLSQDRGRDRTRRNNQLPILSRSLSAPSSPLLGRKLVTGRSITNSGGTSQKCRRNFSGSSLKGRSPSPTRSEILPSTNCSTSVSSLDADKIGMRKAPSVRSLRDRFGSQSSLTSVEAEQLEDDLKLLHEDSINQRRKEQFAACREKQRLDKILMMCEDFMKQSKKKNDALEKNANLNKLLLEISLHGKDTASDNSALTIVSPSHECNDVFTFSMITSNNGTSPKAPQQSPDAQKRTFRRLVSLERDIYSQTLPEYCIDSHSKLQTENKSPSISPTGMKIRKPRPEDVAEVQQLYESGLEKMEEIQHRISEIETQLDECTSALEMEKALVAGELESERELLKNKEKLLEDFKDKIIDLEEKYMKQRDIQNGLLEKEKKNLAELQKRLQQSQKQLNNCPESIRDIWEVELKKDQDVLEQHLKNFEDIEFQTLENLSRMDEEKEMKQSELIERQKKMDSEVQKRKEHVEALASQLNDLTVQEKSDNQRLHMQRDQAIKELQEHREETSFLERKYYEITGKKPPLPDRESSLRTKSQRAAILKQNGPEDVSEKNDQQNSGETMLQESADGEVFSKEIHNTTSVMKNSQISNPDAESSLDFKASWCRDDSILNYKPKQAYMSSRSFAYSTLTRFNAVKSTSHGEPIAASKSSTPFSKSSTPRSKPYYQRLHDSNSTDSHSDAQRWKGVDALSMSSMDSLDTTTSAWSNHTPDQKEMEQVKRIEKQLIEAKAERQRLLAEVNAYVSKGNQEIGHIDSSDPKLAQSSSSSTMATDAPTTSAGGSSQGTASPASPSSPGRDSAELDEVKLRQHSEPKKQTRPMTRYLPVRSKNFDLREHIESCGHSPDTCRHVSVTATTCRGYLMKMGSRIRTWKKRWFVLDRQKKIISYYHNKHESKLRGMIYFQAVEDVFFDHLKTHRSPNPALTFCVKCYDRTFTLVAPSSESLRIWMDAIVTAAEGYTEYMKTFE